MGRNAHPHGSSTLDAFFSARFCAQLAETECGWPGSLFSLFSGLAHPSPRSLSGLSGGGDQITGYQNDTRKKVVFLGLLPDEFIRSE